MTVADADLSRAVSNARRHEPWLYELELDEEGWAPVDQLLAALREKGGESRSVEGADLDRMLVPPTTLDRSSSAPVRLAGMTWLLRDLGLNGAATP